MINKTMGVGGDYATWGAMYSDFRGTAISDDVTITQISNLATGSLSAVSSINLNGFTFRITSMVPALGNPTMGFLTTVTNNNRLHLNFSGTGTVVQDNLNVFMSQGSEILGLSMVDLSGIAAITFIRHDLLVWGDAIFLQGIYADNPYGNPVSSKSWNICTNAGYYDTLYSGLPGTSNVCENVTSLTSIRGDSLINCAADQVTAITGINYCGYRVSGGGSGAHNLTGLNIAAQFVSTSPASADFCRLKATSVLKGAGAAPSIPGNTLGIRGNARPNLAGQTSMGADQWAGAPPVRGLMMPVFVGAL